MNVFPTVMVTTRDGEPGPAGLWVRSVVTSHGYRLTDDVAAADVVVATDGPVPASPAGAAGLVLIGVLLVSRR